jgi:pantoate--beta-alanine ligase
MELVTTIAEARAVLEAVRGEGDQVGLVPTMGYLHDGHSSLMARAVAAGTFTVTTIFVNPLQFGPSEDLARYPRDLPRDLERCSRAGVDLVVAPSVEEMYPEPIRTMVRVAGLGDRWEGASRPGHFDGVATVVAKLFNLAGACHAYFGEKDWQQLQVVRRLAADLSFPVTVVGCPTVREPDGVAMSSRNTYLSPSERGAAPVLYRALQAGAGAIAGGVTEGTAVEAAMAAVVAAEPLVALDYAVLVHAATLEPLAELVPGTPWRLLIAARLGRTRLIDNSGPAVA